MSQTPVCPKCGAQLPEDAPAGLCPNCLVRAGLESEGQAGPQSEPTAPSPASSGFAPPSVEVLGRQFPQLEILEFLGKGGMGAVYKARQPGLDRLVALKILPPEVAREPAFAERFTREARAMARLSHPNILTVHDFGRTSTLPARSGPSGKGAGDEDAGGEGADANGPLFYFIMEYVDGVNLRQAIQSGGISPKEALAIVPQICEALQFAHDEGIVHRDIKPENILVDKKGRVKIADFGLAKLLGRGPAEFTLTGTQQVMGTPHYMAPEHMEGSKVVDHRADIYSLGVVFYEMLTGELPIGRFAPPSKRVHIDVRLDEVVLRSLEKMPEQRYQHANDVKTDVEQISRTSPPPGPTGAPVSAPAVEAHPGGHRRRPAAWLLVKLAAWTCVLVGAGLYGATIVWDDWWPTIYTEQFAVGLEPQSGAYPRVKLHAERRLYCWGQHEDRPIAKRGWTAKATIDGPESTTPATLQLDSFLERWQWSPPVGQATSTQEELRPEFVVDWMNAAGIDVGKPGVQEEASELIRLLKDAARGVAPGGRGPRSSGLPGGTKIGPYTSDGSSSWGFFWGGSVVVFRLVAAAVLLVVWSPPVVIMVRRHRRRLADARETAAGQSDQPARDAKADVGLIASRQASSSLGRPSPAEAEAAPTSTGDLGWPSTARFSGKAILGAAWAAFFFVVILPSLFVTQEVQVRPSPAATAGSELQDAPAPYAEPSPGGPAWWQWILIFTVLPFGAAAPFGTTILGAVSLSEIRHSRGRLIGLPLALADALLFPLLLLDVVICFAGYYAFATNRLLEEFAFLAILVGLLICAVLDVLIVIWAWRRAAPEALPSTGRDRGDASSADLSRTAPVLTVMGALTVASGLFTFLLLVGALVDTYHFDNFFRQDGVVIPLLVLQTLAVPVGLLMVIGGLASRPQGSSWSRFCAMLGLIPLTPAWLITLPLAIWTLTALRRRAAAGGSSDYSSAAGR